MEEMWIMNNTFHNNELNENKKLWILCPLEIKEPDLINVTVELFQFMQPYILL